MLHTGAFTKVGVLAQTRYRILVHLNPETLRGPLSNWQGKGQVPPVAGAGAGGAAGGAAAPSSLKIAQLQAPTEIRVTFLQTDANLSPSSYERRSQTFAMLLESGLVG